jgi:hypothetical protein
VTDRKGSGAPSRVAATARHIPVLGAICDFGRVGAKALGKPLEDPAGSEPIRGPRPSQRSGDGGFDRAPSLRIDSSASRREPQHGSAPIARSGDAHQHALGEQPLQHTGEGAWMYMEDRGEIAGGDARKQPDDRRPSRCGPVTPRSTAMAFELRSRPCTTAQSSCMNSSTSGRASGGPGSRGKRLVCVIDPYRWYNSLISKC